MLSKLLWYIWTKRFTPSEAQAALGIAGWDIHYDLYTSEMAKRDQLFKDDMLTETHDRSIMS